VGVNPYVYGYDPGYVEVPAPAPCGPPVYDRYGNLIQDPGCYSGQQPYPQQQYDVAPQPYAPQQYAPEQNQYPQQQQYAPQQNQYPQQQQYYGQPRQ
jgi:hypothetical protein